MAASKKEKEDAATAAADVNSDDVPIMERRRRSTRAKNAPSKYDVERIIPSSDSKQDVTTTTTSNRPKRKSAEAALENIMIEDVTTLQEQVFARMDSEERKEYRGWVELESEPAFFNAMLQDLGAKSFKVQEVFGLEPAILADLPSPVHGLIFLFEWADEDESTEDRQSCPDNLWFGNQTTSHACATVALINIIMNAKEIKFGPELEQFRSATKSLPPPHRGHALDTNDFIRAIHNSVARRNDLLNEDLLMDNKVTAASKRKAAARYKKRKKSNATKSNKRSNDDNDDDYAGYHYIAFVPVDGQVWELDGLMKMPLCLGPFDPNTPATWLDKAVTAIQNRMARLADESASYNLLAICHSPLLPLRKNLISYLAAAKVLNYSAVLGSFDAERLANLGLTPQQIATFSTTTTTTTADEAEAVAAQWSSSISTSASASTSTSTRTNTSGNGRQRQ
ncbi:cysteine proteinase [Astrocystis sublimbata]|nr:cysteine proteinase [Astrocystis sublimbata]